MKRILSMLAAALIAAAALAPDATAQADWGLWTSADAQYSLVPKKLTLDIGGEFRLRDEFRSVDKVKGIAGLEYKFNKYLKAGAGYEFIYNHRSSSYENQNRALSNLTGSVSLGRLDFSLREQFQSTWIAGLSSSSSRINPKMHLRSRLKVACDIPKSKFEPYVSAEAYYYLNASSEYDTKWTKFRYTAGLDFRIDKHNDLDLGIKYVDVYDKDSDDESDDYDPSFIIGIGYAFKF
jgi:Opacity protein and related surface antigens